MEILKYMWLITYYVIITWVFRFIILYAIIKAVSKAKQRAIKEFKAKTKGAKDNE